VGALVHGLGRMGLLDDLWRYLGSYEPLDLAAALRAVVRILTPGGESGPRPPAARAASSCSTARCRWA
jgi:hypothetical protein